MRRTALISFLPRAASDAAGRCFYGLTTYKAHCLYVLTDDNPPVADEVRVNFSYVSCLIEIAKAYGGIGDGRDSTDKGHAVMLGILACGAFG